MHVTGSVVLNDPLPINQPLVVFLGELGPGFNPFTNVSNLLSDPNLLDFWFNDGQHTISKSSLSPIASNVIAFGTDASGSIVSWLIWLAQVSATPPQSMRIILDTTGFYLYEDSGGCPGCQTPVPASYVEFGTGPGGNAAFALGGAWSETPLPAALPLFATGLGAMGLFGWWRKRKPQAA